MVETVGVGQVELDVARAADTSWAADFQLQADMVFLNKASDPLKARLMLAGFKVCEVGLSEFLKAGGSAKCLTLKLTAPLLA